MKYYEKQGITKQEYQSAHRWINRNYIKSGYCNECDEPKKTEMSNISGQYIKQLDDWQELCRSCHMKFDSKKFKLVGKSKPTLSSEHMRKIAAKGGRAKNPNKGFGSNRELASISGKKSRLV